MCAAHEEAEHLYLIQIDTGKKKVNDRESIQELMRVRVRRRLCLSRSGTATRVIVGRELSTRGPQRSCRV